MYHIPTTGQNAKYHGIYHGICKTHDIYHGIYQKKPWYTTSQQQVKTLCDIPCDMQCVIYHGISHLLWIYTMVYTMWFGVLVYTIQWYIPVGIRYISIWYISTLNVIYHAISHSVYLWADRPLTVLTFMIYHRTSSGIYRSIYTMVYTMIYRIWYTPWYMQPYDHTMVSRQQLLVERAAIAAGDIPWYIPYEIYHGIYHGIYHMVYTMVYLIWYDIQHGI